MKSRIRRSRFYAKADAADVGTGADAGTTGGGGTGGKGADAGGGPGAADDPASGGKPASGSSVTWPEKWRESYAKDDKTKLNMLSRYASPEAALDGLIAAQQRIRSGELRAPFPDKGTDEEKATWRKENGLPEAPDKYDLKFDNGFVIGEDDKPIVDAFLKEAHEANMTPSQVKGAVAWFFAQRQVEMEQLQEADRASTREAEDALRAEWGQEYRPNMNLIQGLLDMAPEEVRDNFRGARLADGTPLGASAGVIRWLAGLAREMNPAGTLTSATGAGQITSIETEIADIESKMRDKNSDYWKGPKADGMQSRFRDLIDAREKIKARNG